MYFNGNQLLTFTTERKLLLGLRDYLQISTKKKIQSSPTNSILYDKDLVF